MHIGFPSRERTRLIRFLRTLLALERRRAEVSQAKLPGHPSLPARMAGRSGRRGPETTETRPKRPCWGSLQRMSLRARSASLRVDSARRSSPGASSIIAGEPCAVIVVRPHELRDRRVRDLACLEFRVYAVSTRLKAELRAVSSPCTRRIRRIAVIGMRPHTHVLVASRRQTPGRRPESSSGRKPRKPETIEARGRLILRIVLPEWIAWHRRLDSR